MNPTSSDGQMTSLPPRKRLKIDLACELCRKRKVKCDGGRPVCGNCLKRPTLRANCSYNLERAARTRLIAIPEAGFETASAPSLETDPIQQGRPDSLQPPVVSSACAPSEQPKSPQLVPTLSVTHTGHARHSGNGYFGGGSSSAFTGQIEAAIDARLGGETHSHDLTTAPMVDVPLFPSPQADAPTQGFTDGLEYELPPRKRADHLVQAYWSLVHPLFPVLIKEKFMQSYDALFAGVAVDTNERVLVSTLNAILSLSAQLQESLESSERERLSGRYFKRAHDLLHSPMWETGSVDLIQCLLLMSQYLQCTDKPFQTWMVVGSAVRIAQGLGLHLAKLWDDQPHDEDLALKRRIWQSCIIMDRLICIAHGRPAMISEDLASVAIRKYRHLQLEKENQLVYDTFVARALELYEITHHAAHKYFSLPRSNDLSTECTSILGPSVLEEKVALMLQTDGCLNRWESSLPACLRYGDSDHLRDDDISARQASILHLRLLHSRILLFRPMLARCCLVTGSQDRPDGILTERSVEQCASECMVAARNIISIVYRHQTHDMSMLPAWWYRVFYTYTAAMVLAISNLRPDLFPSVTTRGAWDNALEILQAHEHLSESVKMCREALQRILRRIEQIQDDSASSLPSGEDFGLRQSPNFFEDFPLPLDYDSLLNPNSISWLAYE